MPRQRKQKGYVYARADWWVLRDREDIVENGKLVRKQLARRLEPIASKDQRLKRPPRSVETLAEDFLKPLNNQATSPDSTRTLASFLDTHYPPYVKEHLRTSTYNGYRSVWRFHLEPRCGQMRLRDFRTLNGNSSG